MTDSIGDVTMQNVGFFTDLGFRATGRQPAEAGGTQGATGFPADVGHDGQIQRVGNQLRPPRLLASR